MQHSVQWAETIYNESKFWIALVGALWSAFKGIEWIKAIKTNDLHHIQLGVDTLHAEIKDQTTQVVGELRELRGDVRTCTQAMVTAAAAPRTKRTRARKK